MNRAARQDVRNPLLALPGLVDDFKALPPEAQAALEAFLRKLAADGRIRAERAWRTHKAPMAAYWKMVAVYSRHAAIVLRANRGWPPRR